MCKQYANCSYQPSRYEGIISNPSSAAMAWAVCIQKSTSPSEHGLKKKKKIRIEELQRTIKEFEFPFLYFKKGKELSQVIGHLNNFFPNKCLKKRERKLCNDGVKKGKDGVKSPSCSRMPLVTTCFICREKGHIFCQSRASFKHE